MSARTIYFHGVPGSAYELELFGEDIKARTEHFEIANRNLPIGANRFEPIALNLKQAFENQPLRFVGFSLGAACALRVAALLGDQVEHIDLISAAGPLLSEELVDRMAGAAVFRAVRDRPMTFAMMARVQSALAKLSPQLLYKMLFANAQGADVDLRDDAQFRTVMLQNLGEGLERNLNAYRHEISSYTQDWSGVLRQVTQPVSLYHGQSDNWAPPEMAEWLGSALPNCVHVEITEGFSHYSALRRYLEGA